MLLIFDIFTIILGSVFFINSIKKIYSGKYSILHICIIIFYIEQIIPIGVGYFGDLSKIKSFYKYMYLAMTDTTTSIIYDMFSFVTISILYYFAQKYEKKYVIDRNFIKTTQQKSVATIILALGTFVPLVLGVLLAPNSSIYTKYSYFYTNTYSSTDEIWLYHKSTMKIFTYLSFFSIICYYYLSNSKKNFWLIIPIFLLTWINGKRTLLIFILISIVVIDFLKLKRNDKTSIKKVIKKCLAFIFIFLIYYWIYEIFTHKSSYGNSFLLYTVYFSRLCNVKLSIYDKIYTKSMIDYPFQTLIHNFLFFIPRIIWKNKPKAYYLYHSSYIFWGKAKLGILTYAFQVNLWAEFITNGGLLGYFLALLFVLSISKISEKTDNNLIYVTGMSFLILHFAYGFEHIVEIIYIVFIFLFVIDKLYKIIKKNRGDL